MSSDSSRFPAGYTDKHLTRNPIALKLLRGHYHCIQDYLLTSKAESVLEIGCNRGAIVEVMREAKPNLVITGCDLDEEALALARTLIPEVEFVHGSVYEAPFSDNSYDMVVLCEILEHLDDFEKALQEIKRLTRKHVLLSVPNEPLWCILNMLRGMYWSSRGNTPGHINNFSKKEFCSLVEKYFTVVEVRTPTPWTMILAEKKD